MSKYRLPLESLVLTDGTQFGGVFNELRQRLPNESKHLIN